MLLICQWLDYGQGSGASIPHEGAACDGVRGCGWHQEPAICEAPCTVHGRLRDGWFLGRVAERHQSSARPLREKLSLGGWRQKSVCSPASLGMGTSEFCKNRGLGKDQEEEEWQAGDIVLFRTSHSHGAGQIHHERPVQNSHSHSGRPSVACARFTSFQRQERSSKTTR